MEKIIRALGREMDSGAPCVLVSVIESRGSVPRGAGANMLVSSDGSAVGTVGGGAVELAALETAAEVLKNSRGCLRDFQLGGDGPDGLDMACGGQVRLHFRYIRPEDEDARGLAQSDSGWLCFEVLPDGSGEFRLLGSASDAPDKAGIHPREGREFYTQPIAGRQRVFVFGGGHVSRALVPVLSPLGFCCTVADERQGILSHESFPDAQDLITAAYERLIPRLGVTWEDYLVIMTHGHSGDYVLTTQALETPARYIGVLGSQAKAENARRRLREDGFSEEQIKRVICPVGLPIGGPTPEEIAISIAAQMLAVRYGKARNFDF